MKQNITLALDKTLLRRARALAASQGTSVSGLLAAELRRIVDRDEAYQRAKGAVPVYTPVAPSTGYLARFERSAWPEPVAASGWGTPNFVYEFGTVWFSIEPRDPAGSPARLAWEATLPGPTDVQPPPGIKC